MPFVANFMSAYFAPIIVILINFLLIPTLIRLCTSFENHYLHSDIEKACLWRIFFFMFLNVLLIPITEAASATAILSQLEEKEVAEWPSLLSTNLMAQ